MAIDAFCVIICSRLLAGTVFVRSSFVDLHLDAPEPEVYPEVLHRDARAPEMLAPGRNHTGADVCVPEDREAARALGLEANRARKVSGLEQQRADLSEFPGAGLQ